MLGIHMSYKRCYVLTTVTESLCNTHAVLTLALSPWLLFQFVAPNIESRYSTGVAF